MGTVEQQRALDIAKKQVLDLKSRHELVIQEEKTIERDFGWVFFVTTKKYLETKSPGDLVPGIGPLVVERDTGGSKFLSTSVPPSLAIEEYERQWRERKKTTN